MMPKPISDASRGAALLIILAAVVITTSVLSTLVATAHRRHATRNESLDTSLAIDLLRQADAMSAEWLADTSGSIVLPPESRSPRMPMASHELSLAGKTVRITLTAFDQHGMVPLEGSPPALRSTLPANIQSIQARLTAGSTSKPYGLDQIEVMIDADSQRGVFPAQDPDALPDSALAVGEMLATHGGSTRPTINPNTAPIPLVAAALKEAGLSGIEHVIEARSDGRTVPLGRLVVLGDDGGERSIELVSSSRCWAVRTDLTIGSLQQSWWTIWEGAGSRWMPVHRLRISR